MFGQTLSMAMRLVGALRFAHVEDSPLDGAYDDRRVDAQLWRGNRIDRNVGHSGRQPVQRTNPTEQIKRPVQLACIPG
jgi:hypothetical protein